MRLVVPSEIADLPIIASVSGGKDSTALILALREAEIPARYVFADTWRDVPGEAWVSFADHDKYPDVPRLGKAEAKATPIAFRDALLAMARGARRSEAA